LGLPAELSDSVNKLHNKQIGENPLAALQAVVRERQLQQPVQQFLQGAMPSEEESKQQIDKVNVRREDPSLYYDILGKIGDGAFSSIFEVRRKSDNKTCALKFIRIKTDFDRQVVLNEIGIMMMCQENDAILSCYDCFEHLERMWIFLEMMDGGALTGLIKTRLCYYSEDFVRFVCLQVLKGIKFLHDKYIVHRDIKSDNILVSSEGAIKLADFGYSTQLTQENKNRTSQVGTNSWMAPEMVTGSTRYGKKIDVWSFGVLLIELTTGAPPY
jgi:serine/threonine protein kinase